MSITGRENTAVDAVEATGHSCEMSQCRNTVGFGGNPDESGQTTLDAMIMDGTTHNVGAVGGLRRIKQAISVARKVLDNTDHSLLVGDAATQFAVEMGFMEENLTTSYSEKFWEVWKDGNCQPNFREYHFILNKERQDVSLSDVINDTIEKTHTDNSGDDVVTRLNVLPDPRKFCGPYRPVTDTFTSTVLDETPHVIDESNHDTIGIIAIDARGNVASGTSTNGLAYKIPGRVGDSPIAGAGSYADGDIGAAACTGNGDIMMRFLPSYHTVSLMGTGVSPTDAAVVAIQAIRRKYPTFKGAVVAANKKGEYGAACNLWTHFGITVKTTALPDATVYNITCIQ